MCLSHTSCFSPGVTWMEHRCSPFPQEARSFSFSFIIASLASKCGRNFIIKQKTFLRPNGTCTPTLTVFVGRLRERQLLPAGISRVLVPSDVQSHVTIPQNGPILSYHLSIVVITHSLTHTTVQLPSEKGGTRSPVGPQRRPAGPEDVLWLDSPVSWSPASYH